MSEIGVFGMDDVNKFVIDLLVIAGTCLTYDEFMRLRLRAKGLGFYE